MKYTILHPYNIDINGESFDHAIKNFLSLNKDHDIKYLIVKNMYNKHKYFDILHNNNTDTDNNNNNIKFKIKSYTIDPINSDNAIKPMMIKFNMI
jgi:hypothetical protein